MAGGDTDKNNVATTPYGLRNLSCPKTMCHSTSCCAAAALTQPPRRQLASHALSEPRKTEACQRKAAQLPSGQGTAMPTLLETMWRNKPT